MISKNNIDKKIFSVIEIFNQKKFDKVINQCNDLLLKGYKIPVLYNLIGASHSFKNEHYKAIEFYLKANNLDPNNEEIYRNLGKSYFKIDNLKEATKAFNNSLKLKLNNFDCYFNLGLINLKQKKYFESIKNFNKTISLQDNFYDAYYNLGLVNGLIGNLIEAEKNYILAIKFNNNYFQAINNLATVYIRQKKFDNAIHTLKKYLSLDRNSVQARTNLGVAYQGLKKYKDALIHYEKAIQIQPNLFQAISQKLYLKRQLCNWSNLKDDLNQLDLINNSYEEVTPWQLLCIDDSPKNEFIRAKNYSKQFTSIQKKRSEFFNNKKIRIGYFTPDFYSHAGMRNLEGVFKYHDRNKFEIIAFDYGYNNNDNTHNNIKKYFDEFFYVYDLSDKEIADLSIKNKIDIGIHRNGYAQNSRPKIFSYNPCSVQINYLGYPGTTASDSLDYIIADKVVIPDEYRMYYSEKIIYMPDTFYPAYDQKKISDKIFKRKDFGIPDNAFVLCSFNNAYKISSVEFSIWMRIMYENKNCYLILLIKEEEARKNLLEEATKYKIDQRRIIFLNYIDIEDHLARHSLADLFLDTFNYNAHTTAVETLCTGLPLVTKLGNSFSARVCASILTAFEIPELITKSNEDYYKLICKLITNKDLYRKILNRSKKASTKSKLFNSRRYVKNLEKAFEKVIKMKINENKIDNIFLKDQ